MSVAKRRIPPAAPTFDVGIAEGVYAGWTATVALGIPFRVLRDLESGELDRMEAACRKLIVELRIDGDPVDLGDVDVFGVLEIVNAAMKARTALPKR